MRYPRSALTDEIGAFLTDRQARGLRPGTIAFYAERLDPLARYPAARGITTIEAITARDPRAFLLHLGEGHTPGGVHAVYRAVKAFLRWREVEAEPEGWRNPLGLAGLREVVRRRARRAGVPAPTLHSFRRAFALQSLMGHANLAVLARYLAVEEDLRRTHAQAGPVDHAL